MNKQKIIDEINTYPSEYGKENWDRFGAYSVSEDSIKNALTLLSELDGDLPDPEPTVYCDGIVALEWYDTEVIKRGNTTTPIKYNVISVDCSGGNMYLVSFWDKKSEVVVVTTAKEISDFVRGKYLT